MSAPGSPFKPGSLDMAIRSLQKAHAVATVAERAATHDLIELHYLADVLLAILPLLEGALDALDELEAQRS
ncbi:hypothetical protein [Steroidobacter agaridevorans]|uniref:hypothetical protein n=1 Tax=Steroidobacter agaridevorans TaxID=2695856 RepID=UPI00132A6FDE|nr:hypothetical protein [Steroidobacter agaridevorans]GFE91531.1 hypothetical protein GCM10011488_64850 [Steroidobacter agaridevorans]